MSNSFLEGIFGLKNKIALVVGGGGELGKAMAIGLAKAGAEVNIIAQTFYIFCFTIT